MTALMEKLAAYWQGRTGREQALVAGLAAVMATLLLWYVIASPVLAWQAEGRARYEQAAERYLRLSAGLAQLSGEGAAQQVATRDRPVRTITGERAVAHGLVISRVLPDGDDQLNVWLEAAAADSFTDWLTDLDRNHAIRVVRLTADRRGDRLVSAQIVLRREPG